MATTGILQPDGTRCYKGASCRKHGTAARQQHVADLVAKVDALLTPVTETTPSTTPPAEDITPAWWNKRSAEYFANTREQFISFGTAPDRIHPVHWHKTADLRHYVEVETGDPHTQLIAHVDHAPRPDAYTPEHTIRTWLYKNKKPVAMLKVSTFPTNFTYPEDLASNGYLPQSVINTVEVHPDHAGKGYALEIIRQAEKNLLGGRLIHSGGSYTPEGRAALGGKLPYTVQAIKDLETRRRMAELFPGRERDLGDIPQASFDSMRFVGDWDTLWPQTSSDDDD